MQFELHEILLMIYCLNPLSANVTKWSNTLKKFVGKLPTNCWSVFDHFLKLALKGLMSKKGMGPAEEVGVTLSEAYQ